MPRLNPPPGFVSLKDAARLLNRLGLHIGDTMIYKYVEQGRLKRYGPESRKQKYYSEVELEALAEAELAFHHHQTKKGGDAAFALATLSDMDEVTRVAGKLFVSSTLTPIPAATRRSWMEKEPRGHYIVKRSNGEVVAYLHLLALEDERIEAYMRDEIRGRDIVGSEVQVLEPGKPTSCIVASIGTDPDIEPEDLRSNYVAVLLRGVRTAIEDLGRQGIIIPRLYAYSESKKGIAMCALMGMQQYAPPKKRRYTFWLDVLHSPTFLVQGYQRSLAEWQSQSAQSGERFLEIGTHPK